MPSNTRLSFGVNVHAVDSGAAFAELIRRAEAAGCDVFAAADHLGGMEPFATLSAAATIAPALRLRTYVLNVGFWNAALLARAVSTADQLSGGRIELGLGTGYMKSEHDDAGLPFAPFPDRVAAMQRTATEVRARLARPDYTPAPVQRPVPLVIGAMSRAGLRVAASCADIVAFAGLRQRPGAPRGAFTLSSAAETDARVAFVRERAAGRAYRSDGLLQVIALGEAPEDAAARLAGDGTSAEQWLDTPFALLARDAPQAAAELARRRERYGFDGYVTHQANLGALAEVIAACRASGW